MDGGRGVSPPAFSKPSPWGPTPLVKGRWPKARGDRVRWPRRGRMRGQVSDCICCTQGSFAACGRRVSFPAMGKKPKDRRGTAQDERSALIFALPPVPHYGGRVPARLCKISGAQNLSGDLRFLPGHWALASPKFQSVRFLFRAWLYRANAPSAHTAVGATLAVALSLPL